MKRDINSLAAVVYADLFGYPLTLKEAKLWAIRENRLTETQKKTEMAKKIVAVLKKISTIQAIFLTGSVAAGNAKQDADIDLMIITKPNSLWLTRLVVFSFLKYRNHLKKPFCPNIFIDINHLEVQDQNIYTAHEVLQAKCLYDSSGVEKLWLLKNKWTSDYLPKIYNLKNKNLALTQSMKLKKESYWIVPVEFAAFVVQYLYMKKKISNENVGWGYAFFHPNNLSKSVPEKFRKRLVKYLGNEKN